MNLIYLDLAPAYIPFLVQATKGDGSKIDPTVDTLIIYEEGGADATFDSTTITGSPFDPAKVNTKTGLWGVLVAKSALTAGKWYVALWEMTVDGITTAKVERYFVCNASQFKADVSALALEANIETHVTTSLNTYDPPTRTEATADKDAIITQVDANEAKIDTISSNLTRALGLILDNHVEDDIVRDGSGNKTSSILYHYNSAANATTHDKVTGLIGKYNVVATYSGNNMTLFKVTRVT